MMRITFPVLAVFLLFFSVPAQAKTILSIEMDASAEIIALNLENTTHYKVFSLSNPERLVVDVPLNHLPAVSLPDDYEGSLIEKIRAGRFNADTVRIVFELKSPAKLLSKSLEDGVLSLRLASKNASKPKPKKPLIVIDAGHGGEDSGAIGPRGSQEKDIVLAYARSLQEALIDSGKYRVQLTRESDKFIPLRERVKIARKAGGAIFISLHADSAPKDNSPRGLSVYTLSEKASDAETEALAASENKVDILGGMDLSNEREDVADILISLAQRETRNQSALLADLLATSLDDRVKLLANPHRFAGFAVLKAPDIPSVLIETGFISHPEEERLLKTKEYRQKLITGIIGGIDRYFAKQGNMP